MKKSIAVKLLALAMLVGTSAAQAAILNFAATLTNDQERPVTPPPQGTSGFAFFQLNETGTQLTYFLDTTGLDFRQIDPNTGISNVAPVADPDLTNNVTRIHIHRAPIGQAGGIVFGMVETAGNAANTLNDLDDLQVDIANGIISGAWDGDEAAFDNPANRISALTAALRNGELYINVHTTDFGGGEIRGQILVPEPGTLALIGLALTGLYISRRESQKAKARA